MYMAYCNKHNYQHRSDERCPICVTMDNFKREYRGMKPDEGKIRPDQNSQKGCKGSFCGNGCSNKGCS